MILAFLSLLAVPFCARPALALQTQSAPAQVEGGRGAFSLAIYEVRDLVERLTLDLTPPELGVDIATTRPPVEGTSTELGESEKRAQEAERFSSACKRFEQLVLKHLSPKIGDAPEHLQISTTGTLVANLRRDQQLWLEAFLQTQRTFDGLIQVEARMLTVPRGVLAKLGVESGATLSSDAHRDALVEQLLSTPDVLALSTPTLTVRANQRANISALHQIAYVKDYTVEIVEPGRQEIADPLIASINEGIVLDLRATPLPGQLFVLDLKLHNAKILRPIRTVKIGLNGMRPTEVEIGLPEVSIVRITSSVVMRDGASVVLAAPAQHDEGDIILVVTTKRVNAPAAPTEAK
jgi:hypothetical protein